MDDVIKQLSAKVEDDGEGWLESTLSQLKIRTKQAKEEVYETITAHESQFSQTFDSAKEIESQVGFVSSSLKDVMRIVRSSDGPLREVMKNRKTHEDVERQLTDTKEAISVLSLLASIQESFSNLDRLVGKDDCVAATREVSNMDTALKSLTEKIKRAMASGKDHTSDQRVELRLLRSLRVKYRHRRSLVAARLRKDLESLFFIRSNTASKTSERTSAPSSSSSRSNGLMATIGVRATKSRSNGDAAEKTDSAAVPKRLSQLLGAMKTMGLLDEILEKLMRDLFRTFIVPIIDGRVAELRNGSPSSFELRSKIETEVENTYVSLQLISKRRDEEEDDANDENVEGLASEKLSLIFQDLVTVLQFIYDIVLGENQAMASLVGRMLWKKFDTSTDADLDSRILAALKLALPSSCSAKSLRSTRKWMREDMTSFLKTLSNIRMLGGTKAKDTRDRLVDFVERLPLHTSQNRRRQLLCAARALIRDEQMYATTALVDGPSSVASQSLLQQLVEAAEKNGRTEKKKKLSTSIDGDGASSSSSTKLLGPLEMDDATDGYFTLPVCRVSVCAQRLVALAREALHDASSGIPEDCARLLLQTSRDVIDMYRAIAPVVHARKIEAESRLPMIVHNDCLYLAHHALFVAHSYREGLPETLKPVATLVDLVPPLRSMAEETYVGLIEKQQRVLRKTLAPFERVMSAFGSSSGEARETDGSKDAEAEAGKAEASAKEAVRILEHLSLAWGDVLPAFIFQHAVVRLAEFVAAHALDAVLSLRSLAQECIPQILHLFSLFLDLESRMKDIRLENTSKLWASLVQASKLIAEYRSLADARALVDSGKLDALGEERARRIFRLISVPMYV